ncbi:MAG: RidA family protein [Dehalococcoidales bacterium]|nr:RidA family protein [Dehalococcoidales bacterium]
MAKEAIVPKDVMPARGFSHAMKVGNTIYVAGQTATDEAGNIMFKGDIVAQTGRAYENIKRTLAAAAGAKMTDIVMMNVYCRDLDGFVKTGEARKQYFGKHFPAATVVQIQRLLLPDALIEIEVIAVVD